MRERYSSGEVRIAEKAASEYLDSIFFVLDKEKPAVVRALGKRQGKIFEIKSMLEEIDEIEVVKIERINVNETSGLQMRVKKGEVEPV